MAAEGSIQGLSQDNSTQQHEPQTDRRRSSAQTPAAERRNPTRERQPQGDDPQASGSGQGASKSANQGNTATEGDKIIKSHDHHTIKQAPNASNGTVNASGDNLNQNDNHGHSAIAPKTPSNPPPIALPGAEEIPSVQPPREAERGAASSSPPRSAEHAKPTAADAARTIEQLRAQLQEQQLQQQQRLAFLQDERATMLHQQLEQAREELKLLRQTAQAERDEAARRSKDAAEASEQRDMRVAQQRQQLADRSRQLREPTDKELSHYLTRLRDSEKPTWRTLTINHLTTRNKHAAAIASMSNEQWAAVVADPEQLEFYAEHNEWLAKWLNLRPTTQ